MNNDNLAEKDMPTKFFLFSDIGAHPSNIDALKMLNEIFSWWGQNSIIWKWHFTPIFPIKVVVEEYKKTTMVESRWTKKRNCKGYRKWY